MENEKFRFEAQRIREAYARRCEGDRYSFFNPGHLFLVQERERRLLALLRETGLTSWQGRKILEIGCGTGLWLGEFIKWGVRPEQLTGLDLLPEVLVTARQHYSEKIGLVCGNGAFLPFASETFDLILQATVFTSILDQAMRRAVAREMLRVLAPRGYIIWYDYHVNNPWNPDVRGVTKGEIVRDLFPGCNIKLRRLTLVPPLARRLAPYSPLLCAFLERLPFLCTHYLGLISKRG